jgi:hypothetical protein
VVFAGAEPGRAEPAADACGGTGPAFVDGESRCAEFVADACGAIGDALADGESGRAADACGPDDARLMDEVGESSLLVRAAGDDADGRRDGSAGRVLAGSSVRWPDPGPSEPEDTVPPPWPEISQRICHRPPSTS